PMSEVGIIFPLMGLAVILSPSLSGWMADRIGRHFMMQFGQISRAVVFFILAVMAMFQSPLWLFAVMLMVNAAAGTFFGVGADAYLTDITSLAERPAIYGRIRIGTNIGWALGPMLGAFLARTPFSLLFALTAILCLVGALHTKINCREAVREHDEHATTTAPGIFRDYQLLKLLACSFLLFLLTSQLYSIMSVYATGVIGVSRNALGMVYSVNGFAVIFCQIPVVRIMDKLNIGQTRRLVGGAVFYALGYVSLAFCSNGWQLALAVFTLTLGEVIVMPSLYVSISGLAPRSGIGRYMAALGFTRGVGYAVGPWVGSLAFDKYQGQPLMLWGLLSLFAVFAAGGFWLISERKQSHSDKHHQL
ncbi:MAG: MFS transporter, partial [Victivallaceae bacterium]|nr:MFS transporter [Victivallaceae bacterium]